MKDPFPRVFLPKPCPICKGFLNWEESIQAIKESIRLLRPWFWKITHSGFFSAKHSSRWVGRHWISISTTFRYYAVFALIKSGTMMWQGLSHFFILPTHGLESFQLLASKPPPLCNILFQRIYCDPNTPLPSKFMNPTSISRSNHNHNLTATADDDKYATFCRMLSGQGQSMAAWGD